MTDYSHLLKTANEISEEIIQKYTKHRNSEDNDALSAFNDKNIKVGFVNDLIEKTERKYFDKWYENSIDPLHLNSAFFSCSIYEFHASDFIILVESTNREKPLLIKKNDLIRHGQLIENTQDNLIEGLFFYILSKHSDPSSFYSNFFKTKTGDVQYVNNIYYIWMNKEFKISFTEQGGLETIREITPHQLIYNFKNDSLKTIEIVFRINSLGFIVKTGYTKVKGDSNIFKANSGLLYSDNSYCKIIAIVFDVFTNQLQIKYYNDLCIEIVDRDPKMNFICNYRRFKKLKSLCYGYFLNNLNKRSETVENCFNSHVDCLLDQADLYNSNKNYFNAFELFHAINTAEICDDMNKKRIKKMWRQWCFKAPSTRTFAMICLTECGGLPRLPIEIIEYIIQLLIG